METSLYSEQVRGLANHEIPGENKIFTKFNFGDAFISLAKALCETLLTLAFSFRAGELEEDSSVSHFFPIQLEMNRAHVRKSKNDQITLYIMVAAALQRSFLVLPGICNSLTKSRK